MPRHRLILMPLRTPMGPWRDTAAEARRDAIEAGLGAEDEHDPTRIYLDELAEIETEEYHD